MVAAPLTTPLSKRRSDEGYSASRDLEKREAYRDLLADAISKEHPYDDAIIVHKLGRFWRNSAEAASFYF